MTLEQLYVIAQIIIAPQNFVRTLYNCMYFCVFNSVCLLVVL